MLTNKFFSLSSIHLIYFDSNNAFVCALKYIAGILHFSIDTSRYVCTLLPPFYTNFTCYQQSFVLFLVGLGAIWDWTSSRSLYWETVDTTNILAKHRLFIRLNSGNIPVWIIFLPSWLQYTVLFPETSSNSTCHSI